jgi:hypothetical protein
VQLLFNRLAGLLTVGSRTNGSRQEAGETYLTNQVVKGLMAIGDWHLLRARAYDVSYQRRGERFEWLAPGFRIDAEKADAIQRAYRHKVRPDETDGRQLACLASRTRTWLVTASIDAVAQTTGRTVRTAVDAAAVYFKTTAGDDATVRADNEFAKRTLEADDVVRVNGWPSRSVRHTIYAALPLVAAAADGDSDAFEAAASQLSSVLTGEWPIALTPETWEQTRARLAHAWLRLVH